MLALLQQFKQTVESRALESFWVARRQGRLRRKPEEIAQGIFATFVDVVLEGKGYSFWEPLSGIGYIDFAIVLFRTLHIVEIKILTKRFSGPNQLEQYMKNEKANQGYLLVFDARDPTQKTGLGDFLDTPTGKIRVITVNINPVAPSKY